MTRCALRCAQRRCDIEPSARLSCHRSVRRGAVLPTAAGCSSAEQHGAQGACLRPCIPACVAQARGRRRTDAGTTRRRAFARRGETRFDSGAAGRSRVFARLARRHRSMREIDSRRARDRIVLRVWARIAMRAGARTRRGTGRLHVPMRGSSTASASRRATGESFTSHARRDVAAVSCHLPTDLSSIHPHPLWMTGRLVGRAARVKRAARAPAQSKTSAGTRTAPSISTRAERDMIAFDTVHWPSTSSASAPTRSVPEG